MLPQKFYRCKEEREKSLQKNRKRQDVWQSALQEELTKVFKFIKLMINKEHETWRHSWRIDPGLKAEDPPLSTYETFLTALLLFTSTSTYQMQKHFSFDETDQYKHIRM